MAKKEFREKVEPEELRPGYYNGAIGYPDCLSAIHSATFNMNGYDGFCVGNVFKYLWRFHLKNRENMVEDLKKARQYVDFLIEFHGGDKDG